MNFNYSTIALSIALLTVTATGFSQTSKDLTFNDRKIITGPTVVEKNIATPDDLNKTAVKDFTRNFKNASNVKWTKSDNGSSVYFHQDGVSGRTTYDVKGKREYTLRYFDESKLPVDVLNQLKAAYQDYAIGLVTQVTRKDRQHYIVSLQNEGELVTVQVSEDGINTVKKFYKAR